MDSIIYRLGRYIGSNPGWAWIQIEVDLRDGLLDEIELVYGGFSWTQRIDYWRVHF
jgi:hypothetical protein